jgi:hypothetical protein
MSKRYVFFQFVDKNGRALTSVHVRSMQNQAPVAQLLVEAINTVKKLPVDLDAGDLQAYTSKASFEKQTPMDIGTKMLSLGASGDSKNPIILEVPQVWFQLVDADTGAAFAGIDVDWAPLTEERSVRDLANAVFNKASRALPENVMSTQFRIYANSADRGPSNRHSLELSRQLTGLGANESNPLIVEVPQPRKRQKPSEEMPAAPRLQWTPDEPRVAVSVQDNYPLISVPLACVRGSGLIGRWEKQMLLFRRQQLMDEWREIHRCSIQTYSLLWIVGPPGTGKSCTALAFACSLAPSEWDVIWMHHSRSDHRFNCMWLHERAQNTCVIPDKNVKSGLPQLLGSASSTRKTIVFLDGFARDIQALGFAFDDCIEWHLADQDKHRLVCVSSMSKIGKDFRLDECAVIPSALDEQQKSFDASSSAFEGQEVEMKTSPVVEQAEKLQAPMRSQTLFKLYSWTLEEYENAIEHDELFQAVQDVLPPYDERLNIVESEQDMRVRRLRDKYFLAGGSARLMFDLNPVDAISYLELAIEAVSDIETCSKLLAGDAASSTVNRLIAIYPRISESDKDKSCLTSGYVMRTMATKLGPDLLKNFAALTGVNPSMDGFIFEAWFFAELTVNGIRWVCVDNEVESRRQQWGPSGVTVFEPSRPIGIYLTHKRTWLAPLKWNQGGYDAVFVDTDMRLVRFVQVTRALTHNFHHIFFTEVLCSLAAEKIWVPFDTVEMVFVVPECNLESFALPTSKHDFEKKALKVAAWPKRSTRKVDLPFENCSAVVQVVGVAYDPSNYRPVDRSQVA